MKNGNIEHSECTGVATFNINGVAHQFGLTKDDFDFLKKREVKLQERIDQTSKQLHFLSEEKVKLERKLALHTQKGIINCSNKDEVIDYLRHLAEQSKEICDESYKGVFLRLPYTSELIGVDELLNQLRAKAL